MKPTNRNIAKFFNLTPEILSIYKNGKRGVEKVRVYEALKEYFIKLNK